MMAKSPDDNFFRNNPPESLVDQASQGTLPEGVSFGSNGLDVDPLRVEGAGLGIRKATEADRIAQSQGGQPVQQMTGMDKAIGTVTSGADAAMMMFSQPFMQMLSGLIGSLVAAGTLSNEDAVGAMESVDRWAYEPKTQEGQQVLMDAVNNISDVPGLAQLFKGLKFLESQSKESGRILTEEYGAPPLAGALMESVPQVSPDVLAGFGGRMLPKTMRDLGTKVGQTQIPVPSMLRRDTQQAMDVPGRIEPTMMDDPATIQAAASLGVTPEQYAQMSPQMRELLQQQINQELSRRNMDIEAQNIAETANAAASESVFKQAQAAKAERDLVQSMNIDPEVVAAANRLGLDVNSIPENVLSDSASFRAIYGGLQSVPASPANAKRQTFIIDLAKKAQQTLEQAGADFDTGEIGQKLYRDLVEQRAKAEATEKQLWETDLPMALQRAAGGNPIVQAKKVRQIINQKIIDKNDDPLNPQFLTSLEKRIWAETNPNTNPTWKRLDDLRKDINKQQSGNDIFPDVDQGELKLYGGVIRSDMKDIADFFNFGDLFEDTMMSTRLRKQIESQQVALFGKQLDNSLRNIVDPTIKNLPKGDILEFKKVMDAIPKDSRRKVLLNALGDQIIRWDVEDPYAAAATFSRWWNTLKKNRSTYDAYVEYLDPPDIRFLNDYGDLSSKVSRAAADNIHTGRLNSMSEAFNTKHKMIAGLIDGGAKVASKVPGLMFVGHMAKKLAKLDDRDLAQKAMDVMHSPQWQMLVREAAAKTDTVPNAERMLQRSSAWKKYFKMLPKAAQADITRVGIAQWLMMQDEQEGEM